MVVLLERLLVFVFRFVSKIDAISIELESDPVLIVHDRNETSVAWYFDWLLNEFDGTGRVSWNHFVDC